MQKCLKLFYYCTIDIYKILIIYFSFLLSKRVCDRMFLCRGWGTHSWDDSLSKPSGDGRAYPSHEWAKGETVIDDDGH